MKERERDEKRKKLSSKTSANSFSTVDSFRLKPSFFLFFLLSPSLPPLSLFLLSITTASFFSLKRNPILSLTIRDRETARNRKKRKSIEREREKEEERERGRRMEEMNSFEYNCRTIGKI